MTQPAGRQRQPESGRPRGPFLWLAAALLLLGVVVAGGAGGMGSEADLSRPYMMIRGEAYEAFRWAQRQWVQQRTDDLASMERTSQEQSIVVRYPRDKEPMARLVMDAAAGFYPEVAQHLGAHPGALPPVQIVIHSDRASLRRVFGWSSSQSALGVYWAGTIRVLSPDTWIPSDRPETVERTYRHSGPTVHELAHNVLDYRTAGSVPVWFSEGVAQYEEYRITGWQWRAGSDEMMAGPYALQDLQDNFHSLPEQAAAYRQSFLLVRYIAEEHGMGELRGIITRLGQGTRFRRALVEELGYGFEELERRWRRWVGLRPL